MNARKPYPSDASDEEWTLIRPSLELLPQASGQRRHDLREVLNALRYVVRSGGQWRMLPHDFPPWAAVYQQNLPRLDAGVFDTLTNDLRALLRQMLGHPLAVHASAADEQDRAHVAPLLEKVQDVTGGNVELAYADQCHTGEARCRHLLRDFERLAEVLTGLHMVAFVGVMLREVSQLLWSSS